MSSGEVTIRARLSQGLRIKLRFSRNKNINFARDAAEFSFFLTKIPAKLPAKAVCTKSQAIVVIPSAAMWDTTEPFVPKARRELASFNKLKVTNTKLHVCESGNPYLT